MSKSNIILTLLVVLLVMVGLVFVISPSNEPKTAQQNAKALIGDPFSLVNHKGENVTNEDFRGKYMLVYFGYTYCPDVCPVDLQVVADAMDLLPKKTLDNLTPIFISVDPDRDSVEEVAQYVEHFHPSMVGLTGSNEQVNVAKKAYRAYASKAPVAEGEDPDSYAVNHSTKTYLMDRNGEYVTHFNHNSDPEVMAKRLQEKVK